ncbi:MAG: hypothetical protein Q8L88_02615 [Bacteroidota bacterium]|nr:hypothetical protein [Bacteroidota bacterium]
MKKINVFLSGLFLTLLLVGNSFSQSNKTDLLGYQEFTWGSSRNTVESILKKQKSKIISSKKSEIEIESKIEINDFPSSINVTKRFFFVNNAFANVVVMYNKSISITRTKRIYDNFFSQLNKKYGVADQDSIIDKGTVLVRFSVWKFKSGHILLRSIELSEDSALKEIENVSIVYANKDLTEKEEKDREKKILNEF